MSNADRKYDFVLWGATGFTGTLVAEYLTETYTPDDLSIAIAGRNERHLRTLADRLVNRTDSWDSLPIELGDATDPESLEDIAGSTRVVCTTVGPYTKYGTPLVEACIEAGTDYCDLTGELNWVRETIDRYHEAAVDAGARIVHTCGVDSIPADIGTLAVQSAAVDEHGVPCDVVRIYLEDGRGGVSGGTLASAVAMFDAAAADPIARQAIQNPYSLAPPGERDGVDSSEQRVPKRDPLRSVWTAPSPMAAVNERVIRRSNALLEYPWGREFRCTEVVPTGGGLYGMSLAALVAGGLGLGAVGMTIGPVRSGLQRFVFPDPGEGPSREQIENGHFTVRILGRGTATDGPFVVEGVISADLDPGYGATARMLSEAALCLVRGETSTPWDGGVLTPASGIGEPLVDRLRDAGVTVNVST